MGLANDRGYPAPGRLDFAAITVNPQTGTLQLRGIFPNPDGEILPGLFARIRAPFQQTQDALLVPADAVGLDQLGTLRADGRATRTSSSARRWRSASRSARCG